MRQAVLDGLERNPALPLKIFARRHRPEGTLEAMMELLAGLLLAYIALALILNALAAVMKRYWPGVVRAQRPLAQAPTDHARTADLQPVGRAPQRCGRLPHAVWFRAYPLSSKKEDLVKPETQSDRDRLESEHAQGVSRVRLQCGCIAIFRVHTSSSTWSRALIALASARFPPRTE
jgi:hypothetical protein